MSSVPCKQYQKMYPSFYLRTKCALRSKLLLTQRPKARGIPAKMSNTEPLEGSVEAIQLVGSFIRGNLEAGEQLLQITGNNELCQACSFPIFYEAIQTACVSTITKSTEISMGIVANMILCEATTEVVVTQLDILNMVNNCLEEHNDPDILTEALRVLANLVYRQKWEVVMSLLENVCLFVQFVVENSLSTRLLTQTYQLVYYIQIYATSDCLHIWNKVWDVNQFYRAALLATSRDAVNVQSADVCNPVVLNEMLSVLHGEMLSNCSGMEWLLLSLDSRTLHCRNATKLEMDADLVGTVVPACIQMLLSTRSAGWDDDNVRSTHDATSISMNNNEKFLILSILENIVYVEGTCEDHSVNIQQEILMLSKPYAHRNKHGFTILLQTMLQISEDAVLVKDIGAVPSVAYLIASLYCPKENLSAQTSSNEAYSLSHEIALILTSVRNFVEMLLLEDVTRWLKGSFGQDGCYLVKALYVLKGALDMHMAGATEAAAKPMRGMVCDIEAVLKELTQRSVVTII